MRQSKAKVVNCKPTYRLLVSRQTFMPVRIYITKTRDSVSNHRHTGLEIFFWGGARICPTRAEDTRTSRGVRGHAPPENLKK